MQKRKDLEARFDLITAENQWMIVHSLRSATNYPHLHEPLAVQFKNILSEFDLDQLHAVDNLVSQCEDLS